MTASRPLIEGERLRLLPCVAVLVRPVMAGDEDRLTATERASLAGSVVAVWRRAASARIAARALLAEFGWPDFSLPRVQGNGPEWPGGLVGSLSHAQDWAAAAVARAEGGRRVGVDVEPAEPIDADVLDLIATAAEARAVGTDRLAGRSLWCAKEAAYKAMFALDGRFLEPREVEVDLARGTACACYGRPVRLGIAVDARLIVALAVA